MSTIVTRSGKGSPLTHAEVDSNFTNLNTDKLELSGGTLTGTLNFGDNVKAQFGASADLQVYHDGSNSYIKDAGTGNLVIGATNFKLMDAATNEYYMEAIANGQVLLYHDNAVKFQTTSTGIDVTGTVVADGLTVDVSDGYGINLAGGTGSFSEASYYWAQGQRAAFGYDGSAVSISDINQSGVTSNKPLRVSLGGSDRLLIDHSTGDISFYEDTGTTAKLTWDASAEALEFGDNVKATFGASDDLQIYHDGSSSIIKDVGTGDLNIDGTNVGLRSSTGEYYFYGAADGAVTLYHDNAYKLVTTAQGINVVGKINCDDEIQIEASTGYGRIEVGGPDGAFLDLKSPHSDDYDGRLITTGSGLSITGGPSTGVALQYSGSSKVSTTANGISVTGSVEINGWTITESGGSLYFATGGTNKMKLDASGNLDVVGSVNANATIT